MVVLHFGSQSYSTSCSPVCEGGGGTRVGKAADGSKGGVHREVSLNRVSWALCPGMWEAELAGKCLL